MIAGVAIETAEARVSWTADRPTIMRKEVREQAATAERQPMYGERFVQRALHGPKGEVRGAVLRDGRIVRLPAHEASSMSELLLPGAPLSVQGEGLVTELGAVINVREIGTSKDTVCPIEPAKPKREKQERKTNERKRRERGRPTVHAHRGPPGADVEPGSRAGQWHGSLLLQGSNTRPARIEQGWSN